MGCSSSKATKTAKEEVSVNDAQPGKTLLAADAVKGAEVDCKKVGPQALVKVSITSARGLRNADCVLADKSDPYCICEVTGKSDAKIETPVVPDKLNPAWNFEGELNGYCVGNSLTFIVKDKDPVKPDDFLGKATLTTSQFLADGFDAEIPLLEAGDGVTAFLKVKVVVVHPKVRVTVLGARALRNADWVGKSDPYCVCEVVGKSESKFETPSIAESLNPEWNHEAEVVGYQIEDSLTFIVKDKDPAKPDDILGKVSLPSDSFLESGFEGELQLLETSSEVASFLKVKVELGEKIVQPSAVDENAVAETADDSAVAEKVEETEVASPVKEPVDITVETQAQPAKTWCC